MSDYLPAEVCTNILTRLPVKSLLRFRSVCKEWYSLIASPHFISQHLERSHATPRTVLRYITQNPDPPDSPLVELYSFRLDNDDVFYEYAEHESPFKRPRTRFHIVGSCNGLLCLYGCLAAETLLKLLLWNPLVGKSLAIPTTELEACVRQRVFNRTFGFGFDGLINHHKVVQILGLDIEGFRLRVEIYSLNSGMWRKISLDEDLQIPFPFGLPQTYLNGVAHWVATIPGMQDSDAKHTCIVMFNFTDEVFGEMLLPQTGSMLSVITMDCLTVLQDSLSLISIGNNLGDGERPSCWVWVMKEYGVEDSWTLLFRVETTNVLDWPVGFRMNGELVMETREASLVSYDPESKQVKDLGIHGCELVHKEKEEGFHSFYLGKYVESLILLEQEVSGPMHIGNRDESELEKALGKAMDKLLRVLTGEEELDHAVYTLRVLKGDEEED